MKTIKLGIMLAGCEAEAPDIKYVYLPAQRLGPVPHSHPHIPAEFDHLDFSAEAQTVAVMERRQKTVRAAGGELSDVV